MQLLDNQNSTVDTVKGKLFITDTTQYGFISDIDDTVLVSHSAKASKKIVAFYIRNISLEKKLSHKQT